jgi:hypothetical protein
VVLPNKAHEVAFNLTGGTARNLFLGNPKYDVALDKDTIYNKLGLSTAKKYALVFYPRWATHERPAPSLHLPNLQCAPVPQHLAPGPFSADGFTHVKRFGFIQ